MSDRVGAAPRDPIGRRDPSAIEVLGLGFAAAARDPVSVVTLLVAELFVGIAVVASLPSGISDGMLVTVGTGAHPVLDRVVLAFSPLLSVTAPMRDVLTAGNPMGSGVARYSVMAIFSLAGVMAVLAAIVRLADGAATTGLHTRDGWDRARALVGSVGAALAQVLGLTLLLGFPLVIVTWATERSDPYEGLVPIAIAAIGLVSWFVFRFVVDAIADGRSDASAAVIQSVRIVLRFPGVAIRLFLLSECIFLGCRALWVGLTGSSVGLFLALLGNAVTFVALTAGRLMFFRQARDILAAELLDPILTDGGRDGIALARR